MSIPSPIVLYNLSDATMKGLLPAGYTPLAYIEFTGTLHIDTGVKANQNTLATVIVSITSGLGNILLSRSDASTNSFSIFYNSTAVYIDFKGYDSSRLTETILYGNKYVLYNSASRRLINSTVTTTSISGSFTTPTNLMLGAKGNDSGVGDEKLKGKVYYCSVSEGNTPKLDLRPAKRDSDGVIGMYDLVSRTFKTNSGSGSFIAGPPLAVGKGGGKSLPEEYLLVEYLESTGPEYIDTGYIPTSSTGTILEFIAKLHSALQIIYGCSLSEGYSSGQCYVLDINWPKKAYMPFGSSYSDSSLNRDWISGKKYTYQLNYNSDSKLYIDGELICTRTGQNDFGSRNIWLFSRNIGRLDNNYIGKGVKICNCKIYNGTTIVRHFFPCYRKSDMKPGMYDTVNGIFYTNAGSGEFILGPTVNAGYTCEVNAAETPNLCTAYAPFQEVTLNDYNNAGSFTLFLNSAFAISDYAATVGKTYTISFDAISPNGTSELLLYNANSNPRYFYYLKSLGNVTTSWQHYSYTFTSSDRGSGNAVSHPVEIYAPSKMKVRIRNLRVSEGSTDWNANKRQGFYTNLSGIYDSSKGWVADFTNNTTHLSTTIPAVGNNFSVAWWELSSNFNDGSMPWGIYPFNPLYSKCLNTGDGSSNPWYKSGTTAIDNISNNVWHHFVVTGNGSANYLYVDGVKYGLSKTFKGLTGTWLVMNGWDIATSYCRNPKISNFQIFNVALTDAQVKELYGK